MYPVGYTNIVQSAPFSYSGSSRVTQQNSCISESHSSPLAPLMPALILVWVGKESTVFCAVLQNFPSLVWDLGHGSLGKGENDPACLPSANCQVPRVLLSPSLQTGGGSGAGTAALQPRRQLCQSPCLSPPSVSAWGPEMDLTPCSQEYRQREAACGSPLRAGTPDTRRQEKKGEW